MILVNHLTLADGEFGPVYQQATDGIPNWEKINEERYAVLKTQLSIYARSNASWSIWLYKDIGFQGMTYVSEDTAYMKLLAPFLQKKREVAADSWGCDITPVKKVFEPFVEWLSKAAPSTDQRYPPMWKTDKHLGRIVRNCLMSEELCAEYASYFEGKTEAELDELAKSFSYENCKQRVTLNEILQEDGRRALV